MGIMLGNFLRAAREQVGLSQNDLAEKLNLKSPQSISNIERGIAPLPRKQIPGLSRLLKIDRDAIIDLLVEEVREKYMEVLTNKELGPQRGAPRKLKVKNSF